MDDAAVADAVHPNANALLTPDGIVKLVHQSIHGRIHLAAVNMPERNGDGIILCLPASGEAQRKADGQYHSRQHRDSFLHVYASSLMG